MVCRWFNPFCSILRKSIPCLFILVLISTKTVFWKSPLIPGYLTAEWDQHLPEMQSFQPLSFKYIYIYIQTCLTKKSMYFFIFERKGIRGTKYGYLLATLWLKQSEEFTFLEYFIFL